MATAPRDSGHEEDLDPITYAIKILLGSVLAFLLLFSPKLAKVIKESIHGSIFCLGRRWSFYPNGNKKLGGDANHISLYLLTADYGIDSVGFEIATIFKLFVMDQHQGKYLTIQDVEEVRIMSSLPDHPNVVRLRATYEDDDNVHLVMELFKGGEFFYLILARGNYTERAASSLERTVIEGVKMCHGNGFIHRDLKPENFLFANKKAHSALKAIESEIKNCGRVPTLNCNPSSISDWISTALNTIKKISISITTGETGAYKAFVLAVILSKDTLTIQKNRIIFNKDKGSSSKEDASGIFLNSFCFNLRLGRYGSESGDLNLKLEDGLIYRSLTRGYFLRGMVSETMKCYEVAVGKDSKGKTNAVAYNSVLEALTRNEKFDVALTLFDRMMEEHDPPEKLTIDDGSFNDMVDGYGAGGEFSKAIEVFKRMGETRCSPDTTSFNILIEQLCNNYMLAESEELFGEICGNGVKPDECTYVLSMDACFKANRPDNATEYHRKLIGSGLRPNLAIFNKLAEGLVKVGKVDDLKLFFDIMVKKLRRNSSSYHFIMNASSADGKHDDVIQIVDVMLDEDMVVLDDEIKEFVKELLGKEGRDIKACDLISSNKESSARHSWILVGLIPAFLAARVCSRVNKVYIFSSPRPPEVADLEDKVDLKGE